MSQQTIRMFEIECDQCGLINRIRHQRKAAEVFRDTYGWDIGKGRIADLCPDCAAMDAADVPHEAQQ